MLKDMDLSDLKGRSLMLCDVLHQKPSKKTDWHDYITFIYRDLITKKKELLSIKDPMYTIYEVKEEYRTFRTPRQFLPMEQLIPHEIKYKDLFKEMANIIGEKGKRYYEEHTTKAERRAMMKYPYILGADISIETYYRVKWDNLLGNDARKEPTNIYLDIEVNQRHWDGVGIPRKGECPIDAVTVVDAETDTAYTFLLHVKDNPLIDEFLSPEGQRTFNERLHKMFDESYINFTYYQYMFEDELEMIRQIFKLIHSLKRDFCSIWNMSFDIPYIIERIWNLGEDPANIMCHSDFPTSTLYFYEDKDTFDFDKKRDYFEISSYTHYLDQMIQYASLRKSQGAIKKVSLGAIGKREIGDTKLDYTDLGNFVEFSYRDYMLYVLYNIKDVLLQRAIDKKVRDTFNYYNSCYNSFCQYKDGLKQTVSLDAFIYRELNMEKHLILGNNINYDNVSRKGDDDDSNDEEEEGFAGAINGNPELNEPEGLILFGTKSMYLFGASIDFDFSAMYPNSICGFNIFATTMIGKLYIENGERYLSYDEDPGKEFMEDLITKDPIHTGTKWFGLPSTDVLFDIMEKRFRGV